LTNSVKIFTTPEKLAEEFAAGLVKTIKSAEKSKSVFTIALSGGNTPKLLFSVLAEKYSDSVNWSNVHFFWVDERCVPPGDSESNYGVAARLFFSRIHIPLKNIHRIKGEEEPVKEAKRYEKEIFRYTRITDKYPVIDLIILGMGDDGHTASIFPGNLDLMESTKVYETTVHPVTGQIRVTLTGKVINNAKSVVFMVTGENKAAVIRDIFRKGAAAVNFPAFYIVPVHGKLIWLLDEAAGNRLE
jgi:6-phosphogluconolactonase